MSFKSKSCVLPAEVEGMVDEVVGYEILNTQNVGSVIGADSRPVIIQFVLLFQSQNYLPQSSVPVAIPKVNQIMIDYPKNEIKEKQRHKYHCQM